MAVNGPDGYAVLMSPNKCSCIMLSLPGVYCCVRASGTSGHFWVVWFVLLYPSLSTVMKNTTSWGIWCGVSGCGWSVQYRRGRRCRIQDTGEFLVEVLRRLPKTCTARVSSQWAWAILFCSKRTSAFVDFVPLKVYERKEIFTRYKMRLLSSNLP